MSNNAVTTDLDIWHEEVPGAVLPIGEDFAWLDIVDGDNCYMPLNSSNSTPGKSRDFGKNGVTGSVTTWHELLQITAPDDECGMVFVRGDFPDSADSILARSQRRNQKGTFGLGINIEGSSDYVLEKTPAQGFINLRWPYTRMNFVSSDSRTGSTNFASYTMCSFVKDHTVYQILRIAPDKLLSSLPNSDANSISGVNLSGPKVTIDVGGTIRFGCFSTANGMSEAQETWQNEKITDESTFGGPPSPFFDKYSIRSPDEGQSSYVLACESETHQRRLEIRVWIDLNPLKLKLHTCDYNRIKHVDDTRRPDLNDVVGLHAQHQIPTSGNRAINVVASFAITRSSDTLNCGPTKVPESTEVQEYLGVTEFSTEAPYRLWSNILGNVPGLEAPKAYELNTVGRTIESILGGLSVPVYQRKLGNADSNNAENSPNGLTMCHQATALLENGKRPDGGTLSDENCREQQKTDMGIALIKSLVGGQEVDLESTL